jgi:hypothetical protein
MTINGHIVPRGLRYGRAMIESGSLVRGEILTRELDLSYARAQCASPRVTIARP